MNAMRVATPPAAAPATPAPVPTTWTTGSTEVFRTGTWRHALPRHLQAPAPCHQACPLGGEIAEWMGLARAGDWLGAWRVLTRHNPFPAIAGRICHHPCESACNRGAWDEALSICKLERFVGDEAIAQGWAFEPPPAARAGHVAIVGGGPAGLSAAFQLRRRGWRVSLYEAGAQLGGLMRHGIPPYRLSRAVLDAEIARIVALGVEVHLQAPLSGPADLQALRAGHDAVFVATGAALPRRLPGLPYDGRRVLDGAAYLQAASAGRAPALGPAVVVIGGGSAALDAARSARRAGHAVSILALESREAMPAQREEVEEALEEGITLLDGAQLERLEQVEAGADGAALRLHCRRVRHVPAAGRAGWRVEPLPEPGFVLAADALLVSIGQDPDLAPFAGVVACQPTLLDSGRDGSTTTPGLWAGGDLASAERFATTAVGMGRRAALAIHHTLLGTAPPVAPYEEVVAPQAIATWYHPHAPRAEAGRLDAAARLADGAEVQRGLGAAQARAEAARCFSCGHCIACDNCVAYCPDLAVQPADSGGYAVLADYCKGCGLCVRECPTGALRMEEEAP
ncbi:MAG: FAD-dependent oxidoreductase [Rubrivivax sp.]|nr:FAD-dependent oxidoreductase [Rubrivivax sp.]